MTVEIIIFYILLIDSIGAVVVSWFGTSWFIHHFRTISRYFPPAKGWALYYLVLVLWSGYLLYKFGALFI